MKPGAFLIKNAREDLVDLQLLAAAVKDGHVSGAAIDVFPHEPSSNNDRFVTPLQGCDNVMLAPPGSKRRNVSWLSYPAS